MSTPVPRVGREEQRSSAAPRGRRAPPRATPPWRGALEHKGLVQTWQHEVQADDAFAAALSSAHRDYAAARWAALSDVDRAHCLEQPWAATLRV